MENISNPIQPGSIVWVPCIPDCSTGQLIPMYSISNFPPCNPQSNLRNSISRGGIKSKDWDHTEDQVLLDMVEEHGTKKWAVIAKEINKLTHSEKMRKGKHCRERWYNHLNPEINSKLYVEGEWGYDEDLAILTEHKVVGNKWSKIAKVLKGRTENAVKNRLNSLIKNARQSMSSPFITESTIVDILIEQFNKLVFPEKEE